MITDLFTVFDYGYYLRDLRYRVFIWLASIIGLISVLSCCGYWIADNDLEIFVWMVTNGFKNKMREAGYPSDTGAVSLFSSVFIYIFYIMLIGLFPFVYTIAAHYFFSFSIALTLWLALVFQRIYNRIQGFLAGFVPTADNVAEGFILRFFEIIRYVVRPFTLGLRLFLNIFTGQIILTILATNAWIIFFCIISPVGILSRFLLCTFFVLELCVVLLQVYIFFLLLITYATTR